MTQCYLLYTHYRHIIYSNSCNQSIFIEWNIESQASTWLTVCGFPLQYLNSSPKRPPKAKLELSERSWFLDSSQWWWKMVAFVFLLLLLTLSIKSQEGKTIVFLIALSFFQYMKNIGLEESEITTQNLPKENVEGCVRCQAWKGKTCIHELPCQYCNETTPCKNNRWKCYHNICSYHGSFNSMYKLTGESLLPW